MEVGKHPDQADYPYWEYEGAPPDPEYYRPIFAEGEATWYQVYETVSEGTPVTPPFATKQELIDYLVEYGDFWDQHRGEGGWPREAAKRFAEEEWAVSMMAKIVDGTVKVKRPRGATWE